MKKSTCALLFSALTGTGFSANAKDGDVTGEWGYTAYANIVNIDSDTALAQGIDDSAYSIGISADYLQNNWITSLGAEIIVYDDNAEFTQVVEGSGVFNRGDVSTESSTANAILAYVGTGYQWSFGEEQDVALTLQGGFSHLFESTRSIDSCSNCYSEDIDVDAGAYVKASLLKSGETFRFGVHIQQFLGGDGLTNAIGLSLGSTF